MKIEIDMAPTGKARARVSRWGHYTPQKTVDAEAKIRTAFEDYMEVNNIEMIEKDIPIEVNICAYYGIPKAYSNKKRELALSRKLYPTKKPDKDNVEKLVYDSLNKVVFWDDSQIVTGSFLKVFSDIPKIVVEVKKVVI